jgi:tetratricopeptide (TPR) repeat protein
VSARGLLLLGATLPLSAGCAYFNALYNAQRLFEEAERLQRAGNHAEAGARYADVVEKARGSYQRDIRGEWADDALYLMGRADLRRGRLFEARSALERALAISEDPEIRDGASLYLGAVTSLAGEREQGLALLDRAMRDLPPGPLRSEGHLWRGRVLLSMGMLEAGWKDLEDAVAGHEALRVSADLERVRWGLAHSDSARAREGARGLLAQSDGAASVDSLFVLVQRAREAWGAAQAASLLLGAEDAPWPADARDGAILARAALFAEAGAPEQAIRDGERAAQGVGATAIRARIWLAGYELGRAQDVSRLDRVRSVLLPAVGSVGVLELLVGLRKVEMLVDEAQARGEAIALFAAGELARDELKAPLLAAALFQRYAEVEPASPWAGKALLAALAMLPDGPARETLRLRLEDERVGPYARVVAGQPVSAEEYERLEQTLRLALISVLSDVSARAAQRDAMVRDRSPLPSQERRVP